MTVQLKNIRSIIVFIVMLTLGQGCADNPAKSIKTTIKGTLPAFKGRSVSISEFDINSTIPVDTVKIDENGHFKSKFTRAQAGFYLVRVDNRNFITLVLNKEKQVIISSDGKNLRKEYSVEGSPDSRLFMDFELNLERNREKVDSLRRTYTNYQRTSSFGTLQMELDKRYQAIFNDQRQYSLRFLEEHCSSLASLLVINRRFGEKKIIDETIDYAIAVKVDSCLAPLYKGNKHLAEFERKLEVIGNDRKLYDITEQRLAIGKKVPDIGLENTSGKTVQLYSLEGKPVILYFWASWDKNSRDSNPVLKEIAAKAGREHLAVYAIGLESYKDIWTQAIKADGIDDWINVTDYLNIHSSAKTLFNIPDEFPFFILLDKDLTIRYRGNNFGDLRTEIQNLPV